MMGPEGALILRLGKHPKIAESGLACGSLADAERKLNVKQTKTSLKSNPIATSKIHASLERIALLTGTQPHEDDHRRVPSYVSLGKSNR